MSTKTDAEKLTIAFLHDLYISAMEFSERPEFCDETRCRQKEQAGHFKRALEALTQVNQPEARVGIRDDFAIAALQGIISNPRLAGWGNDELLEHRMRLDEGNHRASLALTAYQLADAMLEARKATK